MPENDNLVADFDELILPNKTWCIDFDRNLVTTNITDLEAVRQTVGLILDTERYEHIIFSDQYGVELIDLFGENQNYVMSEVKRRVTEALTQDERVTGVENFEYSKTKRGLHVTFSVITDVGRFDAETEVAL
jgi:phage baseplate assembly protein W